MSQIGAKFSKNRPPPKSVRVHRALLELEDLMQKALAEHSAKGSVRAGMLEKLLEAFKAYVSNPAAPPDTPA